MAAPRTPRQVPPPLRPDGEAPRGAYSRFIPREELQNFEAWHLGDLGDPEGQPANATHPAGADTAAPPEPEAPPPPDIDALTQQARQQGYQDGYRDGLAALDAFKSSFSQQISAQLGSLVESFDAEFQGLEQLMSQTLARCATELARQVVRSELQQRPELIAQVAQEAVEALLISARHVQLRVHPDDLPLLHTGAGEALRARETQVVPDASIERGGCKLDADICSVDATLSARWRQAMAAIGQASLWEDRRDDEAPAPRSEP
ncbi:FliH/SctL family protein [Roseateles sp. BYS180W]|uniref:Flagellar assembly protein FliH n=1 Tax=Roseateles rivi TaxID=3299028 RepID=A0ABW7FV34_9BURK